MFEGATSVSPDGRHWEGSTLTFTVTASPAPTADLTVNLTIYQTTPTNGDFVAPGDLGSKTVTVPTSGSATYSVATVDDNVVERDNYVGVQVDAGTGYTPNPARQVITVQVLDDDTPAVSVTAGGNIAEGETATFTVSVSPAPAADLTVSLTVSKYRDFVAKQSDLGSKTITVPTSGSMTYTVATVDDDVDELVGNVSLLVNTNPDAGYRPHFDRAVGSVWVYDDDDPPAGTPVVSITAGDAVTEGTAVTFTVTATPAPTAALPVNVSLWHTDGDFVAQQSDLGMKTITVPTSGSTTYTVATVDDDVDERGGSVGIWAVEGTGYGVHNYNVVAYAWVQDNDDPPAGTPVVSVRGGGDVTEGTDAKFTITASPAPTEALNVRLYISTSGRFAAAGQWGHQYVTVPTSGTATYTVATVDDDVDEAGGSVLLRMSPGSGHRVDDLNWEARVTVNDNDDPEAGTPVVSITAGPAVTEGTDARFVVTATPAPDAALTVWLRIDQRGRFLVPGAVGVHSLTVPTSGAAAYTVATTDDATEEPDGSVTARALAVGDYSLHNSKWEADVTVHDNDATGRGPRDVGQPPDAGGDRERPPGSGRAQPPRDPQPLQLALWTDNPGYRAGEMVRLYRTLDPHEDRGRYREFLYLERAGGGERRYLAPLSAAGELHPDPVDRHGLPEDVAVARSLAAADRVLSWQGEAPAPGLWQFVLELRPGAPEEQFEQSQEALSTRRAWARFRVAERSVLLNRRGFDREIRDELTLRSDTLYYLRHQLFVHDGATLTIEPGTLVQAWGRNAAIIVERGGRIVAEGTPEAPVLLTCSTRVGRREPGCWAGLRILGRAPVTRLEGVAPGVMPAERPVYGGSDEEGSSGGLRYVRVEFAGAGGDPDDPQAASPAIGLYGVGSGTVLDHVQAHASLGDGFAFHGGSAVCDHCVASGSSGAGLSWERGWRGRASHLYVQQGNEGLDGLAGGNDEEGYDREPRSLPTLSNVTLVHARPFGSRARRAVALRLASGSAVNIRDLLATGFRGGGIKAGGRSSLLFGEGESVVSGALLHSAGIPPLRGVPRDAVEVISRDPKLRDMRDFPNPDPRPKADSPALRELPPSDREIAPGWNYIGAFDSRKNWLEKWTVFGPESTFDLAERDGEAN